jgi:hypothetical protein
MTKFYYGVRTYSGHTANHTLWKVLTRRIKHEDDAQDWLDFCKSEDSKRVQEKHEYFIISKWEEEE